MYETITYETILERMLARIPDKFDKREGSVIWDTHSPTAIELQILYIELDAILREAYGDTASRDFLILRCRERGISPDKATNAVLKGVFTPATIDVTGKRFNIGEINYTVTEQIAPGEYQVQCETAGRTGNQYFGQMIPMEYIAGLETAELTAILIPGKDEEDTESLRKRYFDSFNEQAFGGNRADYLAKVRSIEGIGNVKITRIWNGDIRPSDMIPSDEVSKWYESAIDSVPEKAAAWLSAVYTAAYGKKLTVGGTVLVTVVNADDFGAVSDVLLDKVQSILDPEENAGEGYGLAPIGHVVNVQSAQPVSIEIKTSLIFDEGYGWGVLKSAISDAVNAYLLALRQEWADSTSLIVRVSQIEARILAVKGVADITGTLLNGSAENLTLGQYEIPVLGGVSE